jgi:putative RNA 2'-phosphotransferase
MAYVLRHAPWTYELELDDEGWVPLEQLLEGLHSQPEFQNVERPDIEELLKDTQKVRYQLDGDRIRALYGHSIPGKLKKEPATPPDILYHGTVSRFIEAIKQNGLRPMRRQYVHLSVDTAMANLVAGRRGNDIIILQIRAKEASEQGLPFYIGNEHVWLADQVPPEWIVFP